MTSKALKPQYLLALALVSGTVCIFALRANNQHMLALKQTVYQADRSGGDVSGALQRLQAYVTTHMNTDLDSGNSSVYPPLQLVGTYDRLVQAQSALLQKQNSTIYTQAQEYCEKTYPSASLFVRVTCTEDYAASHGMKAAAPIPDSLYKFDFASPRWSPDLAGWSLAVTVIAAAAAIVSLLARLWLKATVR